MAPVISSAVSPAARNSIDVRFGSLADIGALSAHVRFTPKADIGTRLRNVLSCHSRAKPLRVGVRTGGPPISVQRKLRQPSSWCDQFNSICPLDIDKDPYLAALVASSCNVTAMACAALGSNKTSGP